MAVLEESTALPLGEVLKTMQKRIVTSTSYFGVPTQKNPLDFWVYQEMITELKPTVIVEIGNKFGGSALGFAHLFDLMGRGRVIAVDINHDQLHETAKAHPRITFLEGDATRLAETVKSLIGPDQDVLVVEDSSHTYENTLSVLENYNSLVKSGGYFIVEDSNCHHGLEVGPSPGPYEAIERFLESNADFESDRGRESFLITWNPKGFLRRK